MTFAQLEKYIAECSNPVFDAPGEHITPEEVTKIAEALLQDMVTFYVTDYKLRRLLHDIRGL